MNGVSGSSPLDSNRMIGGMMRAAQFDKAFFNLVEKDTSYTTDAWAVVVLVSIISAIGAFVGMIWVSFGRAIVALIGTAIWGVLGFALLAFLVSYIGPRWFKGQGDFGEVQRTLGFAYAPQVLNVLLFLNIIPPLACVTWIAPLVGAVWSAVASFYAIREALDQDNSNALVTIVISFVAFIIVRFVVMAVLHI